MTIPKCPDCKEEIHIFEAPIYNSSDVKIGIAKVGYCKKCDIFFERHMKEVWVKKDE